MGEARVKALFEAILWFEAGDEVKGIALVDALVVEIIDGMEHVLMLVDASVKA